MCAVNSQVVLVKEQKKLLGFFVNLDSQLFEGLNRFANKTFSERSEDNRSKTCVNTYLFYFISYLGHHTIFFVFIWSNKIRQSREDFIVPASKFSSCFLYLAARSIRLQIALQDQSANST